MALIRPEVQSIVRREFANQAKKSKPAEQETLRDQLDSAGLSIPEILGELAGVMNGADSDQSKLKAIEMAMKGHGLLKENQAPIIPVQIIIKDTESMTFEVNPILMPRELS